MDSVTLRHILEWFHQRSPGTYFFKSSNYSVGSFAEPVSYVDVNETLPVVKGHLGTNTVQARKNTYIYYRLFLSASAYPNRQNVLRLSKDQQKLN